MGHSKIQKKSTDTDMTPFVDIAFLILSFFIMATKFKPPEPVEIKTPGSVLSQKMPESNAVLISIDSSNKVYFSLLSEKDLDKFDAVINGINEKQNLGLTPAQISNFRKTYMVGVPFAGLKQLLDIDAAEQGKVKQPGIPVMDTTNNVWDNWNLGPLQGSHRRFNTIHPKGYMIDGFKCLVIADDIDQGLVHACLFQPKGVQIINQTAVY